MASPLTFRNLTSTSIVLKSLERFEDPDMGKSRATAFPSAPNSCQSIPPSAPKLGLHVRTFERRDVDIELQAWESYTLPAHIPGQYPLNPSSMLSSTILRITFQNEAQQRFRIDINVSYTRKASRTLKPLTPNPTTSYTALYHPTALTPHLTIHSYHLLNYSEWMQSLPNTLPLSAISLPGTHNSHTHYRALPSVRCQMVDIATQLRNGIRFLDIRVQPASAVDASKKDLYLVHGAFPVSLMGSKYLAPVLDVIYSFLSANPSETILVSLKREGIGSATDAQLATILENHYISLNAEKWYINDRIPYLGDIRGRIVLVRRYRLSDQVSSPRFDITEEVGPGLDATAWPNNSTHALHGPFCVQDFCEIMHTSMILDKLQHCNAHLVRAASLTHFVPGINTDTLNPIPPGPLYLNFLSGSNFFNVGTWPEKIAKIVNRGVEEWICTSHHLRDPVTAPLDPECTHWNDGGKGGEVKKTNEGDGGAGVVIMDMVGQNGDWDLVRLIVSLNMGILAKVRQG